MQRSFASLTVKLSLSGKDWEGGGTADDIGYLSVEGLVLAGESGTCRKEANLPLRVSLLTLCKQQMQKRRLLEDAGPMTWHNNLHLRTSYCILLVVGRSQGLVFFGEKALPSAGFLRMEGMDTQYGGYGHFVIRVCVEGSLPHMGHAVSGGQLTPPIFFELLTMV